MLRDEASALRLELNESRKATQKEYKSFEQVVNIAQDFFEVKTLIHYVRSSNLTSTTTYASTLRDHQNPPITLLTGPKTCQIKQVNISEAVKTQRLQPLHQHPLQTMQLTLQHQRHVYRLQHKRQLSSSSQSQQSSASHESTASNNGKWQTAQ